MKSDGDRAVSLTSFLENSLRLVRLKRVAGKLGLALVMKVPYCGLDS